MFYHIVRDDTFEGDLKDLGFFFFFGAMVYLNTIPPFSKIHESYFEDLFTSLSQS